ncbi:uncharacterized protein [Argopecten irradians]|uniref:uncharacterized protein n=1 Tax=Argopecten irradians TaxID=31199 RepID=UPI003712DD37
MTTMAEADNAFKARFKPIRPNHEYHACISYHKTVQATVRKEIVNKLKEINFEIIEVCSDDTTTFSESLNSSDAWVEVVTDKYENCEKCESRYNEFTGIRKEKNSKLLQKRIQMSQGIMLRVHSDYSADVHAFSGRETDWFGDLQLAIITRFHAFLSFSESDREMAEEIMRWLQTNRYLFTHKKKFLSLKDAKKAAVENKMSDKVIVLFSDVYLQNREDLDLIEPVIQDRATSGCIPIVVELSTKVNEFLGYHSRLHLISYKDKFGQNVTDDVWKTEMERLRKAIDDTDGLLSSDGGISRRDGPPEKLPFKCIESMVQSVGKIRQRRLSGSSSIGTGFCVGKRSVTDHRYIISAYHVFGEAIDDMIQYLVDHYDNAEQLLVDISFEKKKFENNFQLFSFRQLIAGEVKFDDITDKKSFKGSKTDLENRWNASIAFLDEKVGTLHLDMDIPFMSQKHDVIILKTKEKQSTVPNPLPLSSHSISNFWHLAGCNKKEEIKDISITTWCPVGNSSEPSKIWWLRRKKHTIQHEKILNEWQELDTLGWVPFKCSDDFVHGCSGSPCCTMEDEQVAVQGVYLGCLPELVFSSKQEKPQELAHRHRLEVALTMKEIIELLENLEKNELIGNLGFWN